MQTYVAGTWLLEVKPRAGRVRSRVTGEVVTEIACGRKRQSKHRGREIFWKAWPVLRLEYKTHVKMERPSQSTYVWHWVADDWLGEEFLLLRRERATEGQWETSGVFHVVAWVLLSVSTPPTKQLGCPLRALRWQSADFDEVLSSKSVSNKKSDRSVLRLIFFPEGLIDYMIDWLCMCQTCSTIVDKPCQQ